MQQNFNIKTAQSVTIDYEIATFGERLAAFIVDLIIFFIFYGLMSMVLSAVPSGSFLFIFLKFFPWYGWILYHFAAGVFFKGVTVGKRTSKIIIIRVDGEELSPLDYFVRSIFFIVDLMATAGTLGGLSILGTSRNQRLGGLATNSIVVKTASASKFKLKQILKMDSLGDYEIKYKGVKYLTEVDALTIKKALFRHRKFKNDAHRKALRVAAANTAKIIEYDQPIRNVPTFLKAVLKDYIILTR